MRRTALCQLGELVERRAQKKAAEDIAAQRQADATKDDRFWMESIAVFQTVPSQWPWVYSESCSKEGDTLELNPENHADNTRP